MTAAASPWLTYAITAAMVMLSASMILAFARLAAGPSLADRVVALDMFATVVVSIIAVYSIATGSPEMLRAAIVLALISFLGTLAFARYQEKRGRP